MTVLGRDGELARIDAWLASAGPPLLVIEGEPGIGKTTLWAQALARARALGWTVLSCRPVPSDVGLSHVGLADLLGPVPDQAFAALAPPQRRALAVALLREEASGDLDPRAVGTGLTALLTAVGAGQPLLMAIDDAQWLDPASARSLAFATRRLAGGLAVLAAIRIDGPPGQRAVPGGRPPGPGAFAAIEAAVGHDGWQRLRVGPLSVAALHQMFRQVLGSSFPRPLLVSIHRAAGGNPFYALEIAREVQRVGPPQPGQPLPVPGDHRELVLLRARRLPRATRDALAAVAASPRGSVTGLDLEALAPAERAGIAAVRPDGRVEFTHPLFGSAIYAELPEARRRRLHHELAKTATGPEDRARHLALAADGPDEATASELDLAAAAASARGAADVAVELKELACRLTPAADLAARVRRGIELAERRYFAGDPAGARRELEQWLDALAPGEDRARVLLELGSILSVQGDVDASRGLQMRALGEAETAALRARIHARIAADADDSDLAVEHGEAALALLDEEADPQLYSFALHNVALFKLYSGHGADHAAIEKGMALRREAAGWEMSIVPAFWARNLDDFGTARQRFDDLLRTYREKGDEASISGLLTHVARLEAMTGHMDLARELADEALDLGGQTEQGLYVTMALCAKGHICAFAGDLGPARVAIGQMLAQLGEHPDIILSGMAAMVLGLVALQAGDLAEADEQLARADEVEELTHHREPATNRFQADHAEAVIGLGDLDRAERLVARLEARAAALPRPWTLAVSARCRALLNAAKGDLDTALADYQRALDAHQRLDMPSEAGRTLLALGRLHRRRNERQQAVQILTRAVAVLNSAGTRRWAAIASDELGRTQARRGSPERLTPTEARVCELAASGLRNHEIAARLFLSGKTVEANLTRSYRKLGIRSRAELTAALARGDDPPEPPAVLARGDDPPEPPAVITRMRTGATEP